MHLCLLSCPSHKSIKSEQNIAFLMFHPNCKIRVGKLIWHLFYSNFCWLKMSRYSLTQTKVDFQLEQISAHQVLPPYPMNPPLTAWSAPISTQHNLSIPLSSPALCFEMRSLLLLLGLVTLALAQRRPRPTCSDGVR